MRLIDADALLQEFETENVAHNSDMWHITGIKAFIENQPTAFNLDAVVEQLEQYSKSNICKLHAECPLRDSVDMACENCGALGALDIVRNGGKEQGMVEWSLVQKLMNCFPRSVVNQHGEFIAHAKANEYFILQNCESELDVKCKVLEWFSRGAYKTEPYGTRQKNNEFHKFMLDGINEFLGTTFSEKDMEPIYTYLGNACNHEKTIRFIESGYDMSVLKEE